MNVSEHLLGASSGISLRSARNSGFVCWQYRCTDLSWPTQSAGRSLPNTYIKSLISSELDEKGTHRNKMTYASNVFPFVIPKHYWAGSSWSRLSLALWLEMRPHNKCLNNFTQTCRFSHASACSHTPEDIILLMIGSQVFQMSGYQSRNLIYMLHGTYTQTHTPL